VLGIPFGEERRVAQHDGRQLAGCRGCQHVTTEAVPNEDGQVADVVGVGVGDQDRLDARRRHGERLPVEVAEFTLALEDT
jgi:hypothetical protein